MDNKQTSNTDLQQLIGNTLRWGVSLACVLATIGGILYLWRHGSEPLPDYSHFDYNDPECHPIEYTTLDGIWNGIMTGVARSWIQMGVIALILTPITRVALSLLDYIHEKDWLYAAITALVLTVIITNSIGI